MGVIRDVRIRTETTDAMFEPLRNSVGLLKKWNIPVTEDTLAGLDESPMLFYRLSSTGFYLSQLLSWGARILRNHGRDLDHILVEHHLHR